MSAPRPLYHGSARASVNNGLGGGARVEFCARASTNSLTAGVNTIADTTFKAKAGTAVVLNYRFEKLGGGVEVGTPTFGKIGLVIEDDSNDVDTGAAVESADLIANNALPRTGSVSLTPTQSGTYRIRIEMRRGNNDFGGTSQDWRVFSDGSFQRGGLAGPTTLEFADKGRIRLSHSVTFINLTDRGSAAPTTFASTMNAGGTALQEAVRIESVQDKTQNKQTAGTHVYRLKQRRNGTSTIDLNATSTIISGTNHRSEHIVSRLNYPIDTGPTTYDALVTVETNSALHAANTPQYAGNGDAEIASGNWAALSDLGGIPHLILPGTAGSYASCPDANPLDITGDIDLRAAAALNDWTSGGFQALLAKNQADGTAESFVFYNTPTGELLIAWASATVGLSATSTVAHAGVDGQALMLRATLDVDNGAAGRTARFYTKAMPGSGILASLLDNAGWTQLGADVVQAGTTSIDASTAIVEVGSLRAGTVNLAAGKVFAGVIKDGIAGTTVASPSFTDAIAAPFADAQGNVWSLNGSASLSGGAGLTFVDYKTVSRLASHVVNPSVSVENIFVRKSDSYAEDGNQIPTGAEQFSFIATAENMTVKSGRVLNARSEPLLGVFIFTTVTHEASSTVRASWGTDAAAFKTLSNGWQDDANVVTVSTPPAGVHKIDALAYFPSGTSGSQASQQIRATRTEDGSPAGASDGKDWIAPASFARAGFSHDQLIQGGVLTPLVLLTADRDVFSDADSLPVIRVYQQTASGAFTLFATPTVTNRAGTDGIYDASFTPDAVAEGDALNYLYTADVTIGGFTTKTFSVATAVSFDPSAGGGGMDWTDNEKKQIRQALGVTGTALATTGAGILDVAKANTDTLLARLGAFVGTGVNTVLGWLRAAFRKDVAVPSDIGGAYDPATDSLEAIRDRGDVAWVTATGFATAADVTAAKDAILLAGGPGPWTTGNTIIVSGDTVIVDQPSTEVIESATDTIVFVESGGDSVVTDDCETPVIESDNSDTIVTDS